MIYLEQKGDTIYVMFTCEGCLKELPVRECSPFEAQDLRMLCKECRGNGTNMIAQGVG